MRDFFELKPFPQPRVIRTRYPIVLMHGLGVLGSLFRGGQLHSQALHLRSHALIAYAPNVDPYNSIGVRAKRWKERTERVLAETGAEKVNLIAISMSGLDARYLISTLGAHTSVASLITLSTPHHGSSLVDYALERKQNVRDFIFRALDWLGDASYSSAKSDTEAALAELNTTYVRTRFNPAVPDHPDVKYWSLAACAGKGTGTRMSPVLRPLNAIVYKREGINDGFVAVDSARWSGYLGTIGADHANLAGLKFMPGAFKAGAFYVSLAEMLAAEGL